jgi:hypothetical protein
MRGAFGSTVPAATQLGTRPITSMMQQDSSVAMLPTSAAISINVWLRI